MENFMHPMELARAYSLGTLANEVEFSIEEYKKSLEIMSEKQKKSLLAAKEVLESILDFERDETGRNGMKMRRLGALPRLELLEASNSIIDAWIQSEIPFPKDDDEFDQELQIFIQTLEHVAEKKPIINVGHKNVNNVEKLFSTLGEMALKKIHVSSLYDRS